LRLSSRPVLAGDVAPPRGVVLVTGIAILFGDRAFAGLLAGNLF
jgi:hypothetical protein